ncbi:MAG TPA: hypothetical protein VN930_07170, partial [Xanthobacteraceae bacterium]|nr:hypothetical protein [Xanthobacteraceae bacterium]
KLSRNYRGEIMTNLTRRTLVKGGTALATASASASALARPAIPQAASIRIGWLAALTGPSSAPAIGVNRGVINAAEATMRPAA